MISALRGTVESNHSNPVTFFAGDVGYRVYVPLKFLSLGSVRKKITMFIHTSVRDDAIDLFGFSTSEELHLFEMLCTVSGVGPKTALLVIDRGVTDIIKAISTADVSFFSNIPRLGTKNSQKIIIELKNKLGGSAMLDLSEKGGKETKEISEALKSMGFAKTEIDEAIKHSQGATMTEKLKNAIQYLGK
jgi:Holliday junction DNA helicase RuvA